MTKLCRVSRRHKPYELCRAQTARAAVAKGEEDRRTCRPIDAVVGPLGLSPSGHGSSRGETSVRALLCPRLALLAFFYSLLLFGGSKAEEYVERKEHVISRCQPQQQLFCYPNKMGFLSLLPTSWQHRYYIHSALKFKTRCNLGQSQNASLHQRLNLTFFILFQQNNPQEQYDFWSLLTACIYFICLLHHFNIFRAQCHAEYNNINVQAIYQRPGRPGTWSLRPHI